MWEFVGTANLTVFDDKMLLCGFAIRLKTKLLIFIYFSVFIKTVRLVWDLLISSPEPKAQGELIVYRSSRRLCVWLCVCGHFQTRISPQPVGQS